ncbi:transcription repressor OFP18-like [Solanum pennellii]|uniref:Transcription repressor n=1 Tax=Solanum pennellii TaxID=28526 RepID=A0ABM1H324_SOLPN|nr:transcription repressor OFP18-like [Solanum pennellii]
MKYFTLWKRFSFLKKNKKKKMSRKYDQCLVDNMFGPFPEICCPDEALEMAKQALATRRLSFEENESCSVLSMVGFPFKDCLLLAVETENPRMDFLHSMEQMTKVYGAQRGDMVDWEFMEELLTWFLKINNMKNQHFIVAAFIDLCLGGHVQDVEPVENVEPLTDDIVNVILEELWWGL